MKFKSLATEVAKLRETETGAARDEAKLASRYVGARVRAILASGETVNGKLASASNAGFNGIEIHILVGRGSAQVRRVTAMKKVWIRES